MKKFGIGSRVLTALLVLAMIVSMIPMSIWAAVGDIATEDDVGVTGLTGNVNTQDTISWPIKIFDYLNDGMLFEYPNAGDGGDIPDSRGGAYGGGTPAPHFGGAKTVIGNDYTILGTYDERPWDTWVSSEATDRETNAEVLGTQHAPTAFKEPMYAHFEYEKSSDETNYPSSSGQGTKFRAWISDFYSDNSTYYDKDELRYIVVVYRNNSVTNGAYVDFTFRNSSGTDFTGPSVVMPASSDKWSYFVYDMYKDGWSNIGTDNIRYVKFTFPLNAIVNGTPETIDISHIAYFGSEFEAVEFGKDAVAFDNDPGEMLDSHTEYYPAGTVLPVTKPSVGNNGMDFAVSSGGGYGVSTYNALTTSVYGGPYLGYVNGITVNEVDNGERSYIQLKNSNNTSNKGIYIWNYDGGAYAYQLKYVTIVYKTTNFTANDKLGFFIRAGNNSGAGMHTGGINCTASGCGTLDSAAKATVKASNSQWTYVTYDLSNIELDDTDYDDYFYIYQVGMYLPACLTGSGNSDKSLDIAMIDIRSTNDFDGQQAADYMNGVTKEVTGSYTTPQKQWNTGNNVSFSMLYANQGGGWRYTNSNGYTNRGGDNDWANGYFSYQIGASVNGSGQVYSDGPGQNAHRNTAKELGYPVSDHIFLVGQGAPFDTSVLDLGGYGLFNTFNGGIYTAGLLNSSLITVTGTDGETYRVPDYKEDTVEYIAVVLREALRIGQTDTSGNYNYNFVKGTANGEQYGYDANGKAMDLASALRKELNVVLPAAGGKAGSGYAELGDYATMTTADKAGLIGDFAKCKDNINTFVDAAYYLLMNLYVSDSYNQAQDEYTYLVLSQGTLTANGKSAYIFDGGFTTGKAADTANTDEYRNSSQSAVVYDKELDTIGLSSALSKDQVYFEGSNGTTRFPFLPVTDAEGVYAGETKSPYFLDDGRGVMGVTQEGATFVNRNYNFAMASNGEFVYHYDEGLYFEFEGDDDVYLFINGELVLDIGGAHSVTNVNLDVNEYVDWARKVLANPSAYSAQQIARAKKLNLKDGEKYSFDFYYMERHGWGSNCRIATNIVVTDPTLATDKQAYQGTDVNGDPVEVDYGGIVDITDRIGYSFSITNKGETKLYKLSFMDADIGVNMTYDGGLQIYGQPTVTTVTTTAANTVMTITGLNGMVNLDGDTYPVSASGTQITVANAGDHTLTLYQYEPDPSNPVNPLYTDSNVTVTAGSSSQTVKVAGIRVSDKNGGHLDVSDLIISVDGYASKEDYENGIAIDTFYIEGKKTETDDGVVIEKLTNADLMKFLTNLQDPNGQTDSTEDVTEEEAAANLYAHDGLWQNATVKIAGFYYFMTPEEQAENRFTNTVFTTGYKFKDATAPLKSQDRHRVYGLGSYAYYQWASNTVHLDFNTMWNDVLGVFASPDESLYEQREQIDALNQVTNTLQVEVTDKRGDALTASYNLYANGVWGTYDGADKVTPSSSDKRIIYFKNVEDWTKNWTEVYAYYWSSTNTTMSKWPGTKMQETSEGSGVWYVEIPSSAENIIFGNGSSGYGNQTVDLALPETAFTAVKWNATNRALEVTFNTSGRHIFYVKVTSTNPLYYQFVVVPIVFYVADVENSAYVLDYGLATQTISSAELLKYDDFLANYGMTKAQFMGYLTSANNPRYLGTFTSGAFAASNINRVAYDGSALTGNYTAADGVFNLTGTTSASVTYADGKYNMDGYSMSFTPNKIMDEEYSIWMAFRVYNENVKKWNQTTDEWTTSTFTPNAIGPENASASAIKYTIDIHNELQMLKKVTFLPATVVYYEDDFADITYHKTDANSANFTTQGTGSGSLKQGIAVETPYGQDEVYQSASNALMSGNSLHKIKINTPATTDANGNVSTPVVASFAFKGTGFEIISRTNAYDSASFYITVKDASGNIVKKFPVITEYDNTGSKACSHTNHGSDGACATCGQTVDHTYVVEKAHTYWLSVSKSVTKVIFSDGASQSVDIVLNTKAVDAAVKSTANESGSTWTMGTYTVKQDPNNSDNWRIYFTDTSNMGRMYLYAWSGEGDSTVTHTNAWPGSAMEPASFCSVCGKAGVDYYLVGYINKSDYTGTNHKFVNGQVTLNITDDSYVYVHSSIGEDYQTSGFDANATSAFLYQNASNADKLRVPGNVEARFTLAVNEDGSLTLSYGTAALESTGETGGESDGDESDATRVYYDNSTSKWSAVNIHYWGNGSTEWPGVAMTQISGTDIYYYDVPSGMTHVIFNDGNGTQTQNITLSEEGNIYIESSRWAIYDAGTGKITELGIPTTLYYDNSKTKWSQVRAYYWTEQKNIIAWNDAPVMTQIGNTDIYSVTIPAHMEYVIFNDGSGNQTDDIRLTAKGNIYTADGVWATYDPATGEITGGVCKHVYTSAVTTEPTCSKTGVRTYTCSFCNDQYTETIATTAHSYSNGQCTVCGSGYAIHQVPVIRVDGLTYGNYTVEIHGVPTYDFSNATVDQNGNVTGHVMKDTYLYIDGIRIYQPLNATNPYYYGAENGAIFTELRNMILEGKAAVAQYVKDQSKVYTGNLSWTENRNGKYSDKTEFLGNRVGKINDYMIVGPNNEVYMNGNAQKQAIVFYVTEDTTVTGHTLQIGARAIDAGLFLTGNSTGVEAALYQGVATNSNKEYAWKLIDTIQSGTEQYYNIDYSACPYTEENGVKTYQVVLYVRSGMVSFSSVKTNGINIVSSGISEPTTLVYNNGGRLETVTKVEDNSNTDATGITWNFRRVSDQMNSTVFLDAEEPDTTPDSGNNDSTIGGDEFNPVTGDVALVNLILIMLTCLAFVCFASRKKLIG